jgi:hypothetical protein
MVRERCLMETPLPSRRRFPRIPSEHLVLVNKVGDAEAEQLARTCNMSRGGCMVRVRERLGNGSVVQVLVKIGDQVVDSLGRVVYEIPRRRGEVDVGIEFLYLADGDQRRLASLIGEGKVPPEPG